MLYVRYAEVIKQSNFMINNNSLSLTFSQLYNLFPLPLKSTNLRYYTIF